MPSADHWDMGLRLWQQRMRTSEEGLERYALNLVSFRKRIDNEWGLRKGQYRLERMMVGRERQFELSSILIKF